MGLQENTSFVHALDPEIITTAESDPDDDLQYPSDVAAIQALFPAHPTVNSTWTAVGA